MELKAQLGNKPSPSVSGILIGRFLRNLVILALIGAAGYTIFRFKIMEQILLNFKGYRVKGTVNMVDPQHPEKVIYAYRVNGKTYMASMNKSEGVLLGDTIEVVYYPSDPSVSRLMASR